MTRSGSKRRDVRRQRDQDRLRCRCGDIVFTQRNISVVEFQTIELAWAMKPLLLDELDSDEAAEMDRIF
ncbi:MAG TPA: hypothetical protein VNS22_11750 [Geminicoccus sp.]|uniref:hypothetical protein n=1 Tax=Geminicoccus sp. TaxID=2024832 RepID=UPI002D1D42AB|nr:hypothetical protein [Geminicoccus sp.]HWL69046.1 hypothetical protein [Geminicoccus sp.]